MTEVLQEKGIELIISIHTFLAEGDEMKVATTLSNLISIHTFLAEGDINCIFNAAIDKHFNPHLPCGR